MNYSPCGNGAMMLTVFVAVITVDTLEVVIGRISCWLKTLVAPAVVVGTVGTGIGGEELRISKISAKIVIRNVKDLCRWMHM